MRKAFLLILTVAVVIAGCSGERFHPAESWAAGEAAEVKMARAPAEDLGQGIRTRKLIQTVSLVLRVDDSSGAAKQVEALTHEAGGYLASTNAYLSAGLRHVELTLRVPVENLEEVLQQLEEIAVEVERETRRSEDVTDQYVDLEARLRTLAGTETELQALLAESRSRGHDVEDIMAIYERLTQIRTRIEQLRGKLNSLDNLTTYATVNVELVPTEAAQALVAEGWSPGKTLRQSFGSLVAALQSLADAAIVGVVVLLPLAFLICIPLWLLAKVWRRARRKSVAKE
jgi:hypothetical protein